MKKPILTILTPTYNRKHLLGRLHASLVAQDVPPDSFEWLVVDDGSTDGTAGYVRGLQAESTFKILVLEQPNGGKHRAVNLGVKHSAADWVMIVDSDDWLLPNGVAHVLEKVERFHTDRNTQAICFPHHIIPNGNGDFRLVDHTVNFREWKNNIRVGDSTIVIRKEMHLYFPFLEVDGESFIAESSAFARMFRGGGIRLRNERIVAGEYLADGLSSKALQLRIKNPIGAASAYYERLNAGLPIRKWLGNQINYHRFYCHAIKKGVDPEDLPGRIKALWFPLGWLLYQRDTRRF